VRSCRILILPFLVAVCATDSKAADSVASADYAFDTAGLTVKPLDISASIELYPALLVYNQAAPLYALRFETESRSVADYYNLKAEATVRYQHAPFIAFASGALTTGYSRPDDSIYPAGTIYEGYLKYALGSTSSLLAGKRLFQWGKGYVFNPVAFAGRQKDPNDIDATLEGYWNLSFEYVKSFNPPLSSLAFTGAVLPAYGLINSAYLPDSTLASILQIAMLLYDTDVDLCFFVDSRRDFKAGIDFSRNLLPALEVHGEWAYRTDATSLVFTDDTTAVNRSRSALDFTFGSRYLAPFNTTFIFEYLHLGNGYSTGEMDRYCSAMTYAQSAGNPQRRQWALRAAGAYYNTQFLTTDYLFLKATHPDPFTIVYFTPSLYSIVNIIDGSMMSGFEMTYSRSRHLLLTARSVVFSGGDKTEYRSKLVKCRFEFRGKWSF
jgi:hypothetical protein